MTNLTNLFDSYEIQTIEIEEIMFPPNKMTKLRFEITDIYKDNRFKDTAISLLMLREIEFSKKITLHNNVYEK